MKNNGKQKSTEQNEKKKQKMADKICTNNKKKKKFAKIINEMKMNKINFFYCT